jgi:CrcB protein
MSLTTHKEAWGIFFGGALGSLARFWLSSYIQSVFPKNFPWGILLVNITGCLLIGLLAGFVAHRWEISPVYRAMIFIGFLGGFTTFSSFSLDTILLWQSHAYGTALINITVSLFAGLGATALGLWLALRA